jgi:hypothetical protein
MLIAIHIATGVVASIKINVQKYVVASFSEAIQIET